MKLPSPPVTYDQRDQAELRRQVEDAFARIFFGEDDTPRASSATFGVLRTDVDEEEPLVYVKATVDTLLAGKSDVGHTHDDRYYTEAEVDALIAPLAVEGHAHDASDIISGVLAVARIPDLSAAKITSGTLDDARLSANIARLDTVQTWTARQSLLAEYVRLDNSGVVVGELDATTFDHAVVLTNNLRYGGGDPHVNTQYTYISAAGAFNIAGAALVIKGNGAEIGTELNFLTTPTSLGAGVSPASLTSRWRVTGTGEMHAAQLVLSSGRLYFQTVLDASLANDGNIVIGPTTGENITIDNNEIIARNNGAAGSLHLQTDGGSVTFGNNARLTSWLLRLSTAAGAAIRRSGGGEVLRLEHDDASDVTAAIAYMRFVGGATNMGYIGYPSAGNQELNIINQLNAALDLGTNNAVRWQIVAGGTLRPGADNAYAIGEDALRPSHIFARHIDVNSTLTLSGGLALDGTSDILDYDGADDSSDGVTPITTTGVIMYNSGATRQIIRFRQSGDGKGGTGGIAFGQFNSSDILIHRLRNAVRGPLLFDLFDYTAGPPHVRHTILQLAAGDPDGESILGPLAEGLNVGLRVRANAARSYLWLESDTDNDSGEPGGAYVRFSQDSALIKAQIGLTQGAALPDGTGVTNGAANALIIAHEGTGEQIILATGGHARLRVHNNADPLVDTIAGVDFKIGNLGRFDSTDTPSDLQLLVYRGGSVSKWRAEDVQFIFNAGDTFVGLLPDNTSVASLLDDPGAGADSPAGAPPAPVLGLVATHKSFTVKILASDDPDVFYHDGEDFPADFRYFEVEKSTNGTDWSALATVSADKVVHGRLTEGQTYHYRARAVDRAGNASAYSATVSAPAEANSLLAAFGSLVATDIAVDRLSALSANIGVITAGLAQNADGTRGIRFGAIPRPADWHTYLDFDPASGSDFVLNLASSKLTLTGDGDLALRGSVYIGPNESLTVDSQATFHAGAFFNDGSSTVNMMQILPSGTLYMFGDIGSGLGVARTIIGAYNVTDGTPVDKTETGWSATSNTIQTSEEGTWIPGTGITASVDGADLPAIGDEFTIFARLTAEVVSGGDINTTVEARLRLYVDEGVGFNDRGIIATTSRVLSGATNLDFSQLVENINGVVGVEFKLVPEVRITDGSGTQSIVGRAIVDVSSSPYNKIAWQTTSGTVHTRRGVKLGVMPDEPQFHVVPMSSSQLPADSDLVEGDFWFDGEEHVPRWFDGEEQEVLGGARYVRKTTNQNHSSTSFSDVNELSFAVGASRKYHYKFVVIWQTTNAAAGIGFGVNGPSSPGSVAGVVMIGGGTLFDSGGFTAYNTGPIITGAAAANTNYTAIIEGEIETGATAGNIALRVRAEGATTVSVRAGSFGVLTPVAS